MMATLVVGWGKDPMLSSKREPHIYENLSLPGVQGGVRLEPTATYPTQDESIFDKIRLD